MKHQQKCSERRSTTHGLIATVGLMLVLATSSLLAQLPTLGFAYAIGGASLGQIVADANGNCYLRGSFAGTVDFDPGSGTANLTSTNTRDGFVAMYTSSGNYLWAFHLSVTPQSMAVDGSGNVLIAGNFQGTVDFDPGVGVATLTSGPGASFYVAKYSPTGNYLWAFKIDAGMNDMAVDGNGAVVVVGTIGLATSVDFDPGPGKATLQAKNSGNTSFVAKYSSSGAYQWAFKLGGGGGVGGASTGVGIDNVTVDGSNRIVVTGGFSGKMSFDPSSSKGGITAGENGSMYTAKYTSAGKYSWVTKMDGWIHASPYTDGAGNIYLLGQFSDTVDFDPSGSTANMIAWMDNAGFIAKYNSSGAYQWAFELNRVSGMAFDGSDNFYVTGSLRDTVDLDPSAATAILISSSPRNAYVASYSPSGSYRWGFAISGTSATETLGPTGNFGIDGAGNLYLGGGFIGTFDFDPSAGVFNLTSSTNGITDAWFARYSAYVPPKRNVNIGIESADAPVHVVPNPFANTFALRTDGISGAAHVQIIDMMGRVVEAREIDDANTELSLGADLPAGTYFVRVTQANGAHTTTIYKVK